MKEKNFAVEKAENIANGNAAQEVVSVIRENERVKNAERERARDEKYKRKAAARRERLRRKAELKEQREYMRRENRKMKEARLRDREPNKGGNGGWLAAVITLSLATLILASALTFTVLTPTESDNRLETSYRRAFFDTVEQVDNMDLNLSKALASRDSGALQLYLVDLAVNSELAENNIQQLPIEDESKFYTTKIINQVGDFAKYLNKKAVNGEAFTSADYENLKNLYKANVALKNALQAAMRNMDGDYAFSDMGKDFEGNALLKNFDELQELSVEYPELIYDGPFSDGRDNVEMKGLVGGEITEAEAVDIFGNLFKDYELKNVSFAGRTTGKAETFGVQAEVKGENLYAQISVIGGKLLMFSYAGSCGEVNFEQDYAVEKALEFLASAGMENMKPVWINLHNNLYTINFAPEIDGVIIYPDLVKVRVCAETCMIIGMEATGYYANHTERTIATPALTKAQARNCVSAEIAVETARLAIVPIGESSEKLCYEFSGEYDGETYYVYIDAESGRQVAMFKVINSEEGSLLM